MRVAAAELRADVARRYDWDVATDLLEGAYLHAMGRRKPKRPAPALPSPVVAHEPAQQVLAH